MNIRWAGLTAPFRWLVAAIDIGRHQPGLVLAAIATIVALEALPGLFANLLGGGSSTTVMVAQFAGLLLGLLVAPVLKAGLYDLLERSEQGRDGTYDELFAGFRNGRYGALVAVTLLSVGVFLLTGLAMALAAALTGALADLPAVAAWFEQVQALQAKAGAGTPVPPDQMPMPPQGLVGIGLVMLAFSPVLVVLTIASHWALIAVALRGLGPVAGLATGLRAAFVNAPSILLVLLVLLLPLLLIAGMAALLLGGIIALANLAGPAVGNLVSTLLVMGIAIVLSGVAYGFLWQGWQDSCGGRDEPTGPSTAPPGHFEA